jgi:hypothetical protein
MATDWEWKWKPHHSKYVLNYDNTLKARSFITIRKFINQGPDRNETNKDLSGP